ncbi:hypothetical protein SKAU_G00157840 [Synaphobranchus kaupii]|uniref:Uncharacterized protein n=1 Tax=Synaphobranchus kaupii TaxID=118154 RepID=A0A9Q1FIB1_SYNKA|nr:hypothetical protein SKAU_G00157840 [Synaphobranchus kaupii]
MLVPQWLKSARVVLVEVRDGRTYSGSAVSSGESETWNLQPPVRAGEYACYVTFYVFNKHAMSSLSDSVIVTTGSWYPPSTGLIVGALFTTLIGAGILVYVCICRVHKEGSQGNSAPEEAQTEISTTTPWADAENQTTTPGDNTEDPETPPGSDTENPISTPEANTDRPRFSLGEEHAS